MDYHRTSKVSSPSQNASDENLALAAEVFDHFCSATTLRSILGLHRHMCDLLKIRPTNLPQFYPKLKSKLRSWKAQALWKRLDVRASHKCYSRGRACPNTRVLVIGSGPCGLRSAIEAQLLGAKVVVIEKRDRISRNNVLHLWPFVIQDLRALGAKKFFGKFCAGSIDHISIRQLQCILLKVALLLGVEFHEGVGFESLIYPNDQNDDKHGWRAEVSPADHPVSQYEFDVLIGADGKRNTLDGFKRKEFRGKLAIAITANFINKHTEAEARVEEISGVAFIFNQKFFKDLFQETGIDLENIVYYKDDTHYFVMTAKKHSLIDKGVIKQDLADTAKLLSPENVNRDALMEYAREAAEFSTNYQMKDLEFAVNHYGQPDVAMFDFTSMYAAENASRVIERKGYKLLMCLVGDSLLEPFWPTGSGCARGFLSSLDACWAIRGWGTGLPPLDVIAERESIYRLLAQTTPENLNRDYSSYTLNPSTRYPNLNRFLLKSSQVRFLYDKEGGDVVMDTSAPGLTPAHEIASLDFPKKKRRRDTQIHPETLIQWIKRQVTNYNTINQIENDNIAEAFKNGLVLCAIIHRYRPELIDWEQLRAENGAANNQLAFNILEKEFGITPVMTGEELSQTSVPDKLTMLSYLSQIYEVFHGEIPQISNKMSKIDMSEFKNQTTTNNNKWGNIKQVTSSIRANNNLGVEKPMINKSNAQNRTFSSRHHPRDSTQGRISAGIAGGTEKRRKRRDVESVSGVTDATESRSDRVSKRKMQKKNATEQFYKSLQMLHTNARAGENSPFEDYSLFIYRQTAPNFVDRVKDLENKLLYPDRDQRYQDNKYGSDKDENFSSKIKQIEQKMSKKSVLDKKPPDLLRAIGKIESSDWNVKEIEKKIQESKSGGAIKNRRSIEKERVPKWSREQFLARQTKMEKRAVLERTDSLNEKYIEIDKSLKKLDQKLKEGNVLEQGSKKVATMLTQFDNKKNQDENNIPPPIQKSNSKPTLVLPAKGGSEMCHFCGTRVYLMERLSAEGRFFHRGCFRCQYCSINLRLGFYVFDAQHGQKFYCPQHAGMQGKTKNFEKIENKLAAVQSINKNVKDTLDSKTTPTKKEDITPERIEFANSSTLVLCESDDPLSQIDEDEWTDRNFGQSAAEAESSDFSESDSDDMYEEALEKAIPIGEDEDEVEVEDDEPIPTRKKWTRTRNNEQRNEDSLGSENYNTSSDEFSYYDYSSEEDDANAPAETEDEENIKVARELRQREVQVRGPPMSHDTDTTGSDTEVASEEESSESSQTDSSTEISTDSEFKLDNTTPTVETFPIISDESKITFTRGTYGAKKCQILKNNSNKLQVSKKQTIATKPNITDKQDVNLEDLNIAPLVPDIASIAPQKNLVNPTQKCFYNLNRTHSTEGIASKVSLELKKQYLLGNSLLSAHNIQKSGSASTLIDSKIKSFHSNISEHQKLLNPSTTISPTMQAFLDNQSKLRQKVTTEIKDLSRTIDNNNKNSNGVTNALTSANDKIKQICCLGGTGSKSGRSDSDDSSKKLLQKSLSTSNATVKSISCNEKPSLNEDTTTTTTTSVSTVKQDSNFSKEESNQSPRSPQIREMTPIAESDTKWTNVDENESSSSSSEDDIDTDSLSSFDANKSTDKPYQELSHSSSTSHPSRSISKHDHKINYIQQNNVLGSKLTEKNSRKETSEEEMAMDSLQMIEENRQEVQKDSLAHKCSSLNDNKKSDQISNLKNELNQLSRNELTKNDPQISSTSSSPFRNEANKKPKTLNPPKKIENLMLFSNNSPKIIKSTSDLSVSSSGSKNDITGTALTETELSDWARDDDGNVTDDLEDIDPDYNTIKRHQKSKKSKHSPSKSQKSTPTTPCATNMMIRPNSLYEHVCGKETPPLKRSSPDLDSIEFMDSAGSDESSVASATNVAMLKNQGYVKFVNVNIDTDNYYNVQNNHKSSLDDLNTIEQIDDDDTKENKTDSKSPINNNKLPLVNNQKSPVNNNKTLAENNTKSPANNNKAPVNNNKSPVNNNNNNSGDYIQHVTRLTSKIGEFGNVRDSIDIRKSRSGSQSKSPPSEEDFPISIGGLSSPSKNVKNIDFANSRASPIRNSKLELIRNGDTDYQNNLEMNSDIDIDVLVASTGKLNNLQDSLENLRGKKNERIQKIYRSKSSVADLKMPKIKASGNLVSSTEDIKILDSILNSADLSPIEKLNEINEERKKRRKSMSPPSYLDNIKNLDNILHSPNLTPTEKLKEIENARNKQKNLIHDMVMDRLKIKKSASSAATSSSARRSSLNKSLGQGEIFKEKFSLPEAHSTPIDKNSTEYSVPDKTKKLRPKTLNFNSKEILDSIDTKNRNNIDRLFYNSERLKDPYQSSYTPISSQWISNEESDPNDVQNSGNSDYFFPKRQTNNFLQNPENKEYFFRKKTYKDNYQDPESADYFPVMSLPVTKPVTNERHSVAFEQIYQNKSKDSFKRSTSVNENLMFTVKNKSLNDVVSSMPAETHSKSVSISSNSTSPNEPQHRIGPARKKPKRTKSFSEISRDARIGLQKSFSGNFISDMFAKHKNKKSSTSSSSGNNMIYCKSEPCLAEGEDFRIEEKSSDDKIKTPNEKKRSIIQAVTDFFHKRRDSSDSKTTSPRSNSSENSSSTKERFSIFRLSTRPKSSPKNIQSSPKEISPGPSSTNIKKSYSNLQNKSEQVPPPVPPLPIEYVRNATRHGTNISDNDLSETNLQFNRVDSTDTLDLSESGVGVGNMTNADRERRRELRRSKQKRLRIAQEIQRQLEENEVKTRELETRGVEVEKILRGEKEGATLGSQEETTLLQEWLSLMSELASLRRTERDLLAKAEQLRLEEQYSLLQSGIRNLNVMSPSEIV